MKKWKVQAELLSARLEIKRLTQERADDVRTLDGLRNRVREGEEKRRDLQILASKHLTELRQLQVEADKHRITEKTWDAVSAENITLANRIESQMEMIRRLEAELLEKPVDAEFYVNAAEHRNEIHRRDNEIGRLDQACESLREQVAVLLGEVEELRLEPDRLIGLTNARATRITHLE